jgi:hypothetical protein
VSIRKIEKSRVNHDNIHLACVAWREWGLGRGEGMGRGRRFQVEVELDKIQ